MNLCRDSILVIGGGTHACRCVQRFLGSGAAIWIISKDFSVEVMRLGEERKVALLKTEIKDAKKFVVSLNPKPTILLGVTSNRALNYELAMAAKTCGSQVYAIDDPKISDFVFP